MLVFEDGKLRQSRLYSIRFSKSRYLWRLVLVQAKRSLDLRWLTVSWNKI